ncbi:polysaccharide deacetylase family protein [Prosthecodimorpha staleyi]|uniref:Chitooligosaccharide deacetylase n=1 Tax=Prosthecodimorpha staleyi TaxID=2840188 RepID=A0A947GEQ3_9HYPH|nr:polysaccharide deacetylase family protein [Prosthecodimorpha staleyi]MBT9292232.1 polysaccharide deacetylase family protein [Prosthecodimorpha staleyi]
MPSDPALRPAPDAGPAGRRWLPHRKILTFHGLGMPGPHVDAAERPYWIGAPAFAAALVRAAGDAAIEITFDDGNLSDLSIALPRLLEAGLTARFFVLVGRIGRPGYLAAPDLAALHRAGMAIGSHGADHVDWRRASDQELRRELHDARHIIEDAIGAAVTEASIPFGAFDARVLGALAAAGYRRVYSSSGGLAGAAAWLVPRNTVRADRPAEAVLDRLAGWRPRAASALRNPLRAWKHGLPPWASPPVSRGTADRGR